jgi:hypothetical protein
MNKALWSTTVAVTCLILLLGAASQPAMRVEVYTGDQLRGTFEPRAKPYSCGGPFLAVYLGDQTVKTADGKVVTGFGFVGWREGRGVRVQVFVMVPAEGQPTGRNGTETGSSPGRLIHRQWRDNEEND